MGLHIYIIEEYENATKELHVFICFCFNDLLAAVQGQTCCLCWERGYTEENKAKKDLATVACEAQTAAGPGCCAGASPAAPLLLAFVLF